MKNPRPNRATGRRSLFTLPNAIALAFFLLCALIAGWLLTQSGINWSSPEQFIQSIKDLGAIGILAYIGFLIVAIVIGPVPSTPVTIAAGAVWGPIPAGIYGVIGLCLGSIAAYWIGRTLGRSTVQALMGKVIYLSSHRGQLYLGWIVLISHMLPFVPYDLISYGAGISGMSFPLFAGANLLGLIPNTFFLTYMGSSFTVGLPLAIGLVVLFLGLLLLLPWGVKRYNWLGLRDTIRIE